MCPKTSLSKGKSIYFPVLSIHGSLRLPRPHRHGARCGPVANGDALAHGHSISIHDENAFDDGVTVAVCIKNTLTSCDSVGNDHAVPDAVADAFIDEHTHTIDDEERDADDDFQCDDNALTNADAIRVAYWNTIAKPQPNRLAEPIWNAKRDRNGDPESIDIPFAVPVADAVAVRHAITDA